MKKLGFFLACFMFLVASPYAEAVNYGGVDFPAGAISFADRVMGYLPNMGAGPVPDITQQDSRQILGVPEQGEMSLGNGGEIVVQFTDNALTGSGDTQYDLYVFEVGGPETTFVEISKDLWNWHSVGAAVGYASGIDIDQFGFDETDSFPFIRLTDDRDLSGDQVLASGADIVAVGARSSGPPVSPQPLIVYEIQAHVGGRSQLIIRGNTLQWHHFEGPAPGLCRAYHNYGSEANSPTIVDSNQGPNIPWVPTGWPSHIGNGTHPESYSDVFTALTPVFPADGRPWKLEQLWGGGDTRIVQLPAAINDYTLVIEFDDLRGGDVPELSGSSFYAVRLTGGTYNLLCSPDDLVDGNDPPCDGETFTLSDYPSGVWVYLWPETDVNKVFFLLNGKIRVRELYAPYELLGGSPLITIGTHTVETEVILKGGETLTLPPVTFTLTEEGDIYNLLCSPDDVVDGSDPQCQGGTFSDQLWVYLWPETDVKRVIFLLDHTTLRKEWHAPYELLKGDPLTRHGDHIVETEVILDGGESIRLPDVTFDLN